MWLPCSPDLNTHEFYMCGMLQDKMYSINLCPKNDLRGERGGKKGKIKKKKGKKRDKRKGKKQISRCSIILTAKHLAVIECIPTLYCLLGEKG